MTTTNGVHNGDSAQSLQNRLNDPQTAAALNQLLDNAELLAFSVSALDGLLRRGDVIADGIAESVADVKAAAPQLDANLGEQLGRLLEQLPQLLDLTNQLATIASSPEFKQLLDTLSNPQTLNAISQLLQNIELLTFFVTAIDGLLQRSETIADNIADSLTDATQLATTSDLDIGELMQTLSQLAQAAPQFLETLPLLAIVLERVKPLVDSGALENLLDSGVLEPKALNVIGQAGTALAETVEAGPDAIRPVGTIGLLRALNDPDTQQVLGFLVKFASNFGQKLN